jgi:hypothetical protein
MSTRPRYFKFIILAILMVLGLSQPSDILALPPHGGEKHHYDKSAVAPELPVREREVRLNTGAAECVRTAWIGDINRRTVICVEYRHKKASR